MPEDITLDGRRGGYITATSNDQDRTQPDYLIWVVQQGFTSDVIANTPETRKWLEDVLRRFRKDASRLKAKGQKRFFRDAGAADARAGKPIDAFFQIEPPKGRRGFHKNRFTESMRAEYEIGWRDVMGSLKSVGERKQP